MTRTRPTGSGGNGSRGVTLPNRNDIVLFILGSLIMAVSYGTVEPVVVAACLFVVTRLVFSTPLFGGVWEASFVDRGFGVNLIVAGITSVYANQFWDASQLQSDAERFFQLSSAEVEGWTLAEIKSINDGALAILIWRELYSVVKWIGFSSDRYVGILVNIVMVCTAGALIVKSLRVAYGWDEYRYARLKWLFTLCGPLWLFAGIHIRDSFVTVGIALLVYVWILFLARPGLGAPLLALVSSSAACVWVFWFLRDEYVLVPLLMAAMAIASLIAQSSNPRWRTLGYGLIPVAGLLYIGLSDQFGLDSRRSVDNPREEYRALASRVSDSDSMGMAYVVNQALPIRVVVGTVYVFVFPIPVWNGFTQLSAYYFLKSCSALFHYFLLPLLVQGVWLLAKSSKHRTASAVFVACVSLSFATGVAATSLESRHLGSFAPAFLLLAMVPDFREKLQWSRYRFLCGSMFVTMLIIHLVWMGMRGL